MTSQIVPCSFLDRTSELVCHCLLLLFLLSNNPGKSPKDSHPNTNPTQPYVVCKTKQSCSGAAETLRIYYQFACNYFCSYQWHQNRKPNVSKGHSLLLLIRVETRECFQQAVISELVLMPLIGTSLQVYIPICHLSSEQCICTVLQITTG